MEKSGEKETTRFRVSEIPPPTFSNSKMKRTTATAFCMIASIGSIAAGTGLILAALIPNRTSVWGEIAQGFTPQAILIAGGLLALAICSSSATDGSADSD